MKWLFTCSMKPQLLHSFNPENPDEFFTVSEIYDDEEGETGNLNFWSIRRNELGASHSVSACSLKEISFQYARFYINHRIYDKLKTLFLCSLSIPKHTQWIKTGKDTYRRYATNGLFFDYKNIYIRDKNFKPTLKTRKLRCVGFGFEDFYHKIGILHNFEFNNTHSWAGDHVWEFCEAYVRHYCAKHNIVFEGL